LIVLFTSNQLLVLSSRVCLKDHSTSGKMNVHLKWIIYVEEMNLELSRLRKDRKCIFGLCGWKTTTPRMHLLRWPRI